MTSRKLPSIVYVYIKYTVNILTELYKMNNTLLIRDNEIEKI